MTGRERGAGSVLVLTATMMIVVALIVAASLGSGYAARHRAAAAADLAALAAATELSGRHGDPCSAAERISRANGADLRECVVADREVEVVAAVAISGPMRWLADPVRRARAEAPPPVRVGVLPSGDRPAGERPSGEWLVPIAGSYRLTARFGDGGPNWSSGTHTGLDFAAPVGTPVVASSAGRVTYAGRSGPYGNLVVIDPGSLVTYYAHLSAITVAVDDDVGAGRQVGAVGTTGNSTGPHLHFEVRSGGAPQDPEQLLWR
jgi:secretion/DNA translocation related TadE-like protein